MQEVMIFFIFILACAESKTDSASDTETTETTDTASTTETTDTAETTEVTCAQTPLDECSNDPQCELVVGSPIVENASGEYCVDNSVQEAQACADAGCSADPTITIAHPPDSEECWMFPSGCLPEGWSYCTQSPSTCE